MRSHHIPVTWEEYELHEWRFGWKLNPLCSTNTIDDKRQATCLPFVV